ncbi:NADH-quinone oxidoreductase subunit K [Mycolicibacterium flavescens]|uniref:Sodium:proton antiporter n=1 Tax=Mycolicibacterium flavescens TaxID=1776 RepID=A0A1E3RCK8_MYCFV|nr:NADH-quinone oxidoreductase subunit K [Mycolicibacterium flavescens]MCV7280109.1 NADH-quinone oxidoreductase subunit K [Mycolicibacterium flavescens]ODQ87626.1 sodium:proton antiporter [Mycolicibacterium flavescens]
MILAFAATAAALFGVGAYMLLQRDLIRIVVGVALISQSSVVALIGASLTRGHAPIDVSTGESYSDPVPQALVLTALVIGLATLALLLALVHRVVVAYRTAHHDELAAEEIAIEQQLQRDQQRDSNEMT